jgi:uncharacterized protein (TIGR02147 family)
MKSLFTYTDFRAFLKDYIANLPRGGRGELAQIARALGIHSTLVSLILAGKRELSNEQAFELTEYLQLSDWEREYFLLLCTFARSGTEKLKNHYRRKVKEYQKENKRLDPHLSKSKALSLNEQAIFYSSWIYSAIRLQTSIGNQGVTLEDLVRKFRWPESQLRKVLDFLLTTQLITEKNNCYFIGSMQTFSSARSPLVAKHHKNWRLKAIERSDLLQEEEMMITIPCTMSRETFLQLREKMVQFTREINGLIEPSAPEELVCLNMDLFYVQP